MYTTETSARQLSQIGTVVRVMGGVKYSEDDLIRQGFANSEVEGFAQKHPNIAFAMLFAAVPSGILAAVYATTFAIIYPIGMLMGWI